MNSSKIHNNSRLYCHTKYPKKDLFFSLVDYRNNYLTSDNPHKIFEFYNGFDNREQLIRWMKERPKGVSKIHEVEGDKDIIVVIPTQDFNGKYAIECRESIFKGLHIIFVESGKDFYFNYAHNCNVGIRKAMEYIPKWIVVSNDDMYKIDDIKKLIDSLKKLPYNERIIVFSCNEGLYHSRSVLVSFRTNRRKIMLYLINKFERKRLILENKFKIKYILGTTSGINKFIYKPKLKIRYTGSFSVFSIGLIKKYETAVFDEVYINGAEDIDQSWRFVQANIVERCIKYDIGDHIGSTLGPYNTIRRLRGILNDTYLNFKIEGGELSLTP